MLPGASHGSEVARVAPGHWGSWSPANSRGRAEDRGRCNHKRAQAGGRGVWAVGAGWWAGLVAPALDCKRPSTHVPCTYRLTKGLHTVRTTREYMHKVARLPCNCTLYPCCRRTERPLDGYFEVTRHFLRHQLSKVGHNHPPSTKPISPKVAVGTVPRHMHFLQVHTYLLAEMHVHIHEAESMYRTETSSLPLLVGAGWVDSTPPNRAVWSAHPYFQLDSTTSTYNSTRPPDVRLPLQTLKHAESSDTRRPSTVQLPVNGISLSSLQYRINHLPVWDHPNKAT